MAQSSAAGASTNGTAGAMAVTRTDAALPKHFQGSTPAGALLRQQLDHSDPLANFQQTTAVLYSSAANATDIVVIESSGLSHNFAEVRVPAVVSRRHVAFVNTDDDTIAIMVALPGGSISEEGGEGWRRGMCCVVLCG